ncbi:hypothetical protein [Lysinibacillus louembei]
MNCKRCGHLTNVDSCRIK